MGFPVIGFLVPTPVLEASNKSWLVPIAGRAQMLMGLRIASLNFCELDVLHIHSESTE